MITTKYIRPRFIFLLILTIAIVFFLEIPFGTQSQGVKDNIVDAYRRSHPTVAEQTSSFKKGSGYYQWNGPNVSIIQKDHQINHKINPLCDNPIQVSEKFLCPPKSKTGGGDFLFTITSEEDLKPLALDFLQKSYPQNNPNVNPVEKGIDFSDTHVAEILFAKPTGDLLFIPSAKEQYSVAIRRDGTNEIVATMVFPVIAEQNENKFLGIASIHPLYTAYKEPNKVLLAIPQTSNGKNDETEYRPLNTSNETEMKRWVDAVAKGESLNPKASFPPISKDDAEKIAVKYLSDSYGNNNTLSLKNEGYKILYVYNTEEDRYTPINMADKPFYEFIYNGQKIWVNAFDGRTLDETELAKMTKQIEENSRYPWFAE